MRKFAALLIAASLSTSAWSQPRSWKPEIAFSLGNATFSETMHWVSGWSYALTKVGQSSASGVPKGPLCLPPNGYVESRVLLEILNKSFAGQRITAEQASDALWSGAIAYYHCDNKV
jgi:hypothetical protein